MIYLTVGILFFIMFMFLMNKNKKELYDYHRIEEFTYTMLFILSVIFIMFGLISLFG
jgi:hypothetical protein